MTNNVVPLEDAHKSELRKVIRKCTGVDGWAEWMDVCREWRRRRRPKIATPLLREMERDGLVAVREHQVRLTDGQ